MSTRCTITVAHRDGSWRAVYCHWDGYPDHTGRLLLARYNDQERAEELVSGGDLSVLGASCSLPFGHSYATPVDGFTIYYARDRGDKNRAAKVGRTFQEVDLRECWPDYRYVWRIGQGWFISGLKESFIRLEEVVHE